MWRPEVAEKKTVFVAFAIEDQRQRDSRSTTSD